MLVTFTNNTSSDLYLSALYTALAAGASVQTRRSLGQLADEQELQKLVAAGSVGLAFTLETGDSAKLGYPSPLLSYPTANRPNPATVPVLTAIFDSTLNQPQWSDGTNWRDAAGVIVP